MLVAGLFDRKTDLYSEDAQPDIFTYNFNGYVGQFVVDRYNEYAYL